VGVAAELRRRGYVPIPRWWVTPDELEVIRRMAHNHEDEIAEVRRQFKKA
jgi:hypothetical protein